MEKQNIQLEGLLKSLKEYLKLNISDKSLSNTSYAKEDFKIMVVIDLNMLENL